MRILFLLALILYFTSGCAMAPALPETPPEKPSIGADPAAKSEIPLGPQPETEEERAASLAAMEAAFDKAEEDAKLDAELAAAFAKPEPWLPEECRALDGSNLRRCWHLYLTTLKQIQFGEECDYSFQCAGPYGSMTCQYGADRVKNWLSICTMKLPGEQ